MKKSTLVYSGMAAAAAAGTAMYLMKNKKARDKAAAYLEMAVSDASDFIADKTNMK